MAIEPAAPVMLSMMICWPSSLPMRSPTMRAIRSVGPPAANGTIRVIGLAGIGLGEGRSGQRDREHSKGRSAQHSQTFPNDVTVFGRP